MRVSGRIGWLLVSLLTLVLVACGGPGDAGTTELAPSIRAASPLASLDPDDVAVCEAMLVMEDGLHRVQAVKLRAGARHRLDQALQSVLTGQDAVLQNATLRMRTRLRTLGLAITNLVLAVEDFRTTVTSRCRGGQREALPAPSCARPSTPSRRWVGCEALVMPTEPPDASPSPSLVPYDSPGPSVQG